MPQDRLYLIDIIMETRKREKVSIPECQKRYSAIYAKSSIHQNTTCYSGMGISAKSLNYGVSCNNCYSGRSSFASNSTMG
jgi:hypothetical protein